MCPQQKPQDTAAIVQLPPAHSSAMSEQAPLVVAVAPTEEPAVPQQPHTEAQGAGPGAVQPATEADAVPADSQQGATASVAPSPAGSSEEEEEEEDAMPSPAPIASSAGAAPRVVAPDDTAVLLMQLSSTSAAASAKRKQKPEDTVRVKTEDGTMEPSSKRPASTPSMSDEDETDAESLNKKRGSLPKSTTNLLKAWLFDHHGHPYPTENEKQEMAQKFGLTVNQISNWFINARRRILQPMKEKAKKFLVQHTTSNSNDSTDEIVHNALKRCVQDVTQSLGQPNLPSPTMYEHHPQQHHYPIAMGPGTVVHTQQPGMTHPQQQVQHQPHQLHQHQHHQQPQPPHQQQQVQRMDMKAQPMMMEAQMSQPQYVIFPPGAGMGAHMISGTMLPQQMMPGQPPRAYTNYIYPPSTAMYQPQPFIQPQHHHPMQPQHHIQYIATSSFPQGSVSATPGIPTFQTGVRPVHHQHHQLQPVYVPHEMPPAMMGALPPTTHHSA